MSKTIEYYGLFRKSLETYPVPGALTYLEVASLIGFGLRENSHGIDRVQEYLFTSLESLLSGGNRDGIPLRMLLNQIAIDKLCGSPVDDQYNVLALVIDATRQIDTIEFSAEENWIKAIWHARLHLELTERDFFSGHSREYAIASSLRTLNRFGIEARTEDGCLLVDAQNELKLAEVINNKVMEAGGRRVLSEIFNLLRPSYDFRNKRYRVGRTSDFSGTQLIDAEVPIGYLLALGLKYFAKDGAVTDSADKFVEILSLAKAYVQVHDLQQFSGYEYLIVDERSNIIELLAKYIRYDWMVGFPQYSYAEVELLVSNIADAFDNAEFESEKGWTLSNYLSVMQAILIISGDASLTEFEPEEISRIIGSGIPSDIVKKILIEIAHVPPDINASVFSFADVSKVDFFFKPLIRHQGSFYALPKPLVSIGFYESLAAIFRDLRKAKRVSLNFEDEMGKLLERILSRELEKKGVAHLAGERYLIPRSMKEKLGIIRDEAECDFVIETEDTIFFMESKKKVLARNSYTGISHTLYADLSKSYFAAQLQLGRHELFLRKSGRMDFESGKILELKGREIQRVALSFLDYWSVQDEQFSKKLFELMIGRRLSNKPEKDSAENRKILDELNSELEEIASHYQDESFHCYKSPGLPYMNIRWLSLFQILLMLKDSKSGADFTRRMKRVRHLTTGSCNWYADYIGFIQPERRL